MSAEQLYRQYLRLVCGIGDRDEQTRLWRVEQERRARRESERKAERAKRPRKAKKKRTP